MSDCYDSDDWQEQRDRALDNWDGSCARCGCRTKSPHVHHVYGLNSNVLEVLCPDCHADHHGNDEIASYRKQKARCKYCGQRIRWEKNDGKWSPKEVDSNLRHTCNEFLNRRR